MGPRVIAVALVLVTLAWSGCVGQPEGVSPESSELVANVADAAALPGLLLDACTTHSSTALVTMEAMRPHVPEHLEVVEWDAGLTEVELHWTECDAVTGTSQPEPERGIIVRTYAIVDSGDAMAERFLLDCIALNTMLDAAPDLATFGCHTMTGGTTSAGSGVSLRLLSAATDHLRIDLRLVTEEEGALDQESELLLWGKGVAMPAHVSRTSQYALAGPSALQAIHVEGTGATVEVLGGASVRILTGLTRTVYHEELRFTPTHLEDQP